MVPDHLKERSEATEIPQKILARMLKAFVLDTFTDDCVGFDEEPEFKIMTSPSGFQTYEIPAVVSLSAEDFNGWKEEHLLAWLADDQATFPEQYARVCHREAENGIPCLNGKWADHPHGPAEECYRCPNRGAHHSFTPYKIISRVVTDVPSA